jgi:hypothetical protein
MIFGLCMSLSILGVWKPSHIEKFDMERVPK